jgi:hypothetical protein
MVIIFIIHKTYSIRVSLVTSSLVLSATKWYARSILLGMDIAHTVILSLVCLSVGYSENFGFLLMKENVINFLHYDKMQSQCSLFAYSF